LTIISCLLAASTFHTMKTFSQNSMLAISGTSNVDVSCGKADMLQHRDDQTGPF